MATKADFTADEWSHILAAPMIASAAVSAAEPSGLWGLLKEGAAGGWALVKANKDEAANALVRAVAVDFGNGEARSQARDRVKAVLENARGGEIKTKALEELRAIASILEAKAPHDSSAYKAWIQGIAQDAAEAAKEGGFLGFGGVPVSDKERATLDEIAAALGSARRPS